MSIDSKSLRKKFLFWGFILLVWAGYIVGTLWYHGYQRPPSRSFTEEEMMRIAVQRAMQRMQSNPAWFMRVSKEDGSADFEYFLPAFVVPYNDVDHLLEENPGCCKASNTIAFAEKYVRVSAYVFYKDNSGEVQRSENQINSRVFFSNNIRYMP